jgi:hypothetical protein
MSAKQQSIYLIAHITLKILYSYNTPIHNRKPQQGIDTIFLFNAEKNVQCHKIRIEDIQ